jgi:peptidoglycan/xylan/chitin deacetylase (PgdA/CDA1 family)
VDACVNGTVPGHDWVAFTIDDGFADQAMMAREVFAAESCPVTIFLISDLIDGKLWPWDDQFSYILKKTQARQAEVTLGAERFKLQLQTPGQRAAALDRLREHCKHACDGNFYGWVGELARQLDVALPATPPPSYRPLTWDQARELESHGVEFGPHSISHRIFSRLGEAEARAEIDQSWRRLREELAHPLPVFAWPTGRAQDYTERDVQLARAAGLLACASTDPDYAHLDRTLSSVHGLCSLRRFPLPSRIRDVLQYGSWIERGKQILRKSVPGV